MTVLKCPFPYFGAKSKIAHEVWKRFGDVPNYVEPFFGSGAVLLGRPDWQPDKALIETVNDKSGYISNFWRAVAAAPEAVAHYADWPVDECSLHARHMWLLQRKDELSSRLEGDPDWYDAKIAGWWVWGMSIWIGGGFCSGQGPWGWTLNENGEQVLAKLENAGMGVSRQLVHLGNAGKGVHNGDGRSGLAEWMHALSERLRRVRVCCGDWTRVMGPSVTEKNGLTAIYLDPPYSAEAGRDGNLYEQEDLAVAHDVRRWCLENGDNPMLRIALSGYDVEHQELERHGWTAYAWKTNGGYSNLGDASGRANTHREVIWFSPHCLEPDHRRLSLFDFAEATR